MHVNNKSTYLLLACALFLGLPAWAPAQSAVDRAKRDEITMVPGDDPAMAAAFKKARDSLDGFIKLLDAPPQDTESYSVKIRISEAGNTEYFWIGNLEREGKRFTGTLNNTPRSVKSVRQGQSMTFTSAEIYDWSYIDRGQHRMVGNFTACALLTHESPESAAAFRKQTGLRCE
jgi:uncharacterized protein YegJ (DUF2314 family)